MGHIQIVQFEVFYNLVKIRNRENDCTSSPIDVSSFKKKENKVLAILQFLGRKKWFNIILQLLLTFPNHNILFLLCGKPLVQFRGRNPKHHRSSMEEELGSSNNKNSHVSSRTNIQSGCLIYIETNFSIGCWIPTKRVTNFSIG